MHAQPGSIRVNPCCHPPGSVGFAGFSFSPLSLWLPITFVFLLNLRSPTNNLVAVTSALGIVLPQPPLCLPSTSTDSWDYSSSIQVAQDHFPSAPKVTDIIQVCLVICVR